MAAMMTRAAAAAAERAKRHPEADKYFKEGLRSIFRQWTALELAVAHQWGGPNSSTKAEKLIEEILTLFDGHDRVYKDDISLILEDVMENDFNTVCEDESPDELGDLLCLMWRQCGEGDFNLVTNALGREYARHEVLSRSQGLDCGDAADSDNEDGGLAIADAIEEGDEGAEEDGEGAAAMEEEEQPARGPDPDGWETVSRGKSKGGGKNKK